MTATGLARPEVLTETGQRTLRQLMRAWFEFERQLAQVPLLRRLDAGTFTLTDYQALLMNLRQQVIEGARWITRAASSFDREHADIRSVIIHHAADEHRDYEMLEADFVASGGSPDRIRGGRRNLGSEILHSYLMYRAGQPNPVDMLGAMWIVEGLGEKMATSWASRIEALLAPGGAGMTRFLRHHGGKDEIHMNRFYGLLDRCSVTEAAAESIALTSRVVGRLYAMQLEEIDRDR
jgi:3-oxoacyl-[acyl-carrier-protein] synthase-3